MPTTVKCFVNPASSSTSSKVTTRLGVRPAFSALFPYPAGSRQQMLELVRVAGCTARLRHEEVGAVVAAEFFGHGSVLPILRDALGDLDVCVLTGAIGRIVVSFTMPIQ